MQNVRPTAENLLANFTIPTNIYLVNFSRYVTDTVNEVNKSRNWMWVGLAGGVLAISAYGLFSSNKGMLSSTDDVGLETSLLISINNPFIYFLVLEDQSC